MEWIFVYETLVYLHFIKWSVYFRLNSIQMIHLKDTATQMEHTSSQQSLLQVVEIC